MVNEKRLPEVIDCIRTKKKSLIPKTATQSDYVKALQNKELIFATGPAGTGKTYLAVAHAASLWERKLITKIIITRPLVEAGEKLGFLPGTMEEKVSPYMRPLFDALYDFLPAEKVERGLDSGDIEIAPLAYMRGRTLRDAFIILDEGQNTSKTQMKMFLTRLGEGSKMVVTGDPRQCDLPKGTDSGLVDAIQLLAGLEEVGIANFTRADVVRRDLVGKIVEAYEDSAPLWEAPAFLIKD